eukprot:scaffold3375_cov101-Isochrysis_galbana.AAC.1
MSALSPWTAYGGASSRGGRVWRVQASKATKDCFVRFFGSVTRGGLLATTPRPGPPGRCPPQYLGQR